MRPPSRVSSLPLGRGCRVLSWVVRTTTSWARLALSAEFYLASRCATAQMCNQFSQCCQGCFASWCGCSTLSATLSLFLEPSCMGACVPAPQLTASRTRAHWLVSLLFSLQRSFTLGVAFIITMNQLNFALGLPKMHRHEKFLDNIYESLTHLDQTSWCVSLPEPVDLARLFSMGESWHDSFCA
jgi:hypothetical protein